MHSARNLIVASVIYNPARMESIPQKGSGLATTKKLQRRKDGTGNYQRPKSKEQYANSNQYPVAGITDLKVRR